MVYELIFDEVIFKQLKKLENKSDIKKHLSNMFDKIEYLGPNAGKLIDSKLFLYEIKSKNPPLRLYFKIINQKSQAYIFEFEMKYNNLNQNKTINKIKKKTNQLFKSKTYKY